MYGLDVNFKNNQAAYRGGAVNIGQKQFSIKNSSFENNKIYGEDLHFYGGGGAMVVYGIKRDRGIEDFADEIGINEDLHVDISNNTEFVNNIERQGQVERYL